MTTAIRRRAILAGAMLAAPAFLAQAQPLTRTVRILSGFPPGGQIDAMARLLAEALRGRYAATVVVENRPGASGRLALEATKAADADGTTLLLTPSDHLAIFEHLYGNRLRYEPLTDFIQAGVVCEFYMGFATGPATPATTLAELIAWGKDRPTLPFGIPGPGTLPHFLGIQMAKATGLNMTAVAYRGDGPSVQDVIGGQIPMSVSSLGSLVPVAGSTPLRVLAVGMRERLPSLPNVPTVVEAGFPQLAVGGWQAVAVKAGTPAPLVAALDAALTQAMATPEMQAAVARLGLIPRHQGAAAAAERLKAEHANWGPIVASSGFTPND